MPNPPENDRRLESDRWPRYGWPHRAAWMVWTVPIIAVADLTSDGVRAVLLGLLLSATVATARRFS